MENTNQRYQLSDVTTLERAEFYKKTYLHLALASLLFTLIEVVFMSIPAIVNLGLAMTQGWTWMIVLGLFMLVTTMAEKWAAGTDNKRL